jgi:hypothetical protein
MKMKISRVVATVLIATAACAGGEKKVDTTAASITPPADDRATAAAKIANAIAANPAGADSILTANGHTRDSFQQLMYEIAADSVMSATYTAAKAQ